MPWLLCPPSVISEALQAQQARQALQAQQAHQARQALQTQQALQARQGRLLNKSHNMERRPLQKGFIF